MVPLLLIAIVLLLVAIFLRKSSLKQRVNARRGFLRLWLALSALWIVMVVAVGIQSVEMVLIPPISLAAIFAGFVWVFEGFKSQQAAPGHVRRVWVIAKGLIFRFRLQDDTIVTVPSVQLFEDARRDPLLASAFALWSAGKNGPLDSLSGHPSIRDYLYNWAIDHSDRLVGKPATPVQSDEKAVWVTPDWKAVWFWLPDGVSMHDLISMPFERYMQDVQADSGLLLDLADWIKDSPTRATLSRHPTVLAYLRQYTTEAKLAPIVEKLQQAKAEGTLPQGLEKLLEDDSHVAER